MLITNVNVCRAYLSTQKLFNENLQFCKKKNYYMIFRKDIMEKKEIAFFIYSKSSQTVINRVPNRNHHTIQTTNQCYCSS